VRLAAALVAVLALALAGCGDDDGGGGSGGDAEALLKRGFATDVDTGVAKFAMELEVRGVQGLDGPLRLELDGPFRAAPSPTEMPDLDMDFEASGAGQTFTGHVIVTRENGWVEFRGETYEVGEELWARVIEFLRRSNQGRPNTFGDAGVDPLDWVDDAETDGEEEIGGTTTTKVTGKLDMEALLRDSSKISTQRLPESTLRDINDFVDDVDFEAWIGDDDIWRRLKAETEFEVPEADRDSLGGMEGGRFSLDMELADPNEPVEIEGPAEARPIDELLRELEIPPGALLGPGFVQPTPG
jgi:hypothetical protein